MKLLCKMFGHRWSTRYSNLREPGVWHYCERCNLVEQVSPLVWRCTKCRRSKTDIFTNGCGDCRTAPLELCDA